MTQIFKRVNLIMIVVFLFSFLWVGLVQAEAGVMGSASGCTNDDYGLCTTAGTAGLNTEGDIPTLAGRVVGTALSVIGILFFILILYAGILWMTSRGKPEQSKKALDAIVAAVIGLILVLAAYAITNFVFNTLSVG